MTDDDTNDRVTVSTYVPAYQRDLWKEDAERMGMSQSEFIRCMVQAGRRGFNIGDLEPEPDLADEVADAIDSAGGITWDVMVDALPDGASEDDLADVLDRLQREGRVTVRRGGVYTIADEGAGEP